ncbi:hypothetical protein [Methanocella conradii]|uniref:hypothetical protein n=1 Tax=Methanocella conradii TaxID=1175444 RepID=UPI00157C482F|nr:hypothetical protein [Methanocella conradii]
MVKHVEPKLGAMIFIIALALSASASAIVTADQVSSTSTSQSAVLENEQNVETISLRGELVDLSGSSPSTDDASGAMVLTNLKNGMVSIALSVSSKSGNSYNATFSNVPVVWENLVLPDGRKILNDINIDDYEKGLFISITVFENGEGRLCLATDVNDKQYSLEGVVAKPLQLNATKERSATLYSSAVKDDKVEIAHGVTIKPVPIQTDSGTIYIVPANRTNAKTKTIIVDSSRSVEANGIVKPKGPTIPKMYGLEHEVYFDAENSVPEQVPSWMVDGTFIQYGVYVEAPNEAKIKDDIRLYDTYYPYNEANSRILGAYEIDTHGMDIDEPDKPMLASDGGWIYPDEITSIWTTTSDVIIRPQDTLFLASYCKSLWDPGEAGGSEMGNAWVNYGAKAYIGSTIDLPTYMDPFTQEFWQSLCYQEQNIGTAEAEASNAIGFAADDMQVLGDSSYVMPN